MIRDKNGNYEVELPLMLIEKQEEVLEKESTLAHPCIA